LGFLSRRITRFITLSRKVQVLGIEEFLKLLSERPEFDSHRPLHFLRVAA